MAAMLTVPGARFQRKMRSSMKRGGQFRPPLAKAIRFQQPGGNEDLWEKLEAPTLFYRSIAWRAED
jgi:hypothetical protein